MSYGYQGGVMMSVFMFAAGMWSFTAFQCGSMEGEEMGEEVEG